MTATDRMDSVTGAGRSDLMGACEPCVHWTRFTRGTDAEACEKCGGKFSQRIGIQVTSFRSWEEKRMKIKVKKR